MVMEIEMQDWLEDFLIWRRHADTCVQKQKEKGNHLFFNTL